MKSKVTYKFIVFLFVIFSANVGAKNILPISRVCEASILERIDDPVTKDPDDFFYYLNIMQGSCYQLLDISNINQEKLIRYFAGIGNPVAKYLIDQDLRSLLSSARKGDISSQIYFIQKNTKYLSTARGNTADETIQIPKNEYQKYIDTMVNLALKGDARAILPTIIYMIDAKNENYSVKKRFNISHKLINNYGQYNMMFAVMLNIWKINFLDFEICISEKESKPLDQKNMSVACNMLFDRDLYNKLKKMSPKERLNNFKIYLSSITLPELDIESEKVANIWNEHAATIAVYSLLNVPYSTELIPFMIFRPSSDYRNKRIPPQYWFNKHRSENAELHNFRSFLLLSSQLYRVKSSQSEIVRDKFIDDIPFVEKAHIDHFINRKEYKKALSLFEKQLFIKGDIDSIYYLTKIYYLFNKDMVKVQAMLEIYSQYRPELANQTLDIIDPQSYFINKKEEFLKKVEVYKKSVQAKIPKDATTTHYFLSWNDAVRPYVLKKLEKLIQEESDELQ